MAKPSKPCEYLNQEQLEAVLSGSYESVVAEVYGAFKSGDVLGVFPGHLIAVVEGNVVRVPWERKNGDIVFGISESSEVECRKFWVLARDAFEASQRYAKAILNESSDEAAQALDDVVELADAGIPLSSERLFEAARKRFGEVSRWRSQLGLAKIDVPLSKKPLSDRIIALDFATQTATESVGNDEFRGFVGDAEEAAEEALLAAEVFELYGIDPPDDLIRFVDDLGRASDLSWKIGVDSIGCPTFNESEGLDEGVISFDPYDKSKYGNPGASYYFLESHSTGSIVRPFATRGISASDKKMIGEKARQIAKSIEDSKKQWGWIRIQMRREIPLLSNPNGIGRTQSVDVAFYNWDGNAWHNKGRTKIAGIGESWNR